MAISSFSKGRGRRSAGFTEINVTPFVDVMLVLLVVFMVTAPLLTVGVPVDLPKTNAAKMNDQVEPLVVSADAQGNLYIQETEVKAEELVSHLLAIVGSNPSETKVYVRGDRSLPYGTVMALMGMLSSAGFSQVSLLAELPQQPTLQGQKR